MTVVQQVIYEYVVDKLGRWVHEHTESGYMYTSSRDPALIHLWREWVVVASLRLGDESVVVSVNDNGGSNVVQHAFEYHDVQVRNLVPLMVEGL